VNVPVPVPIVPVPALSAAIPPPSPVERGIAGDDAVDHAHVAGLSALPKQTAAESREDHAGAATAEAAGILAESNHQIGKVSIKTRTGIGINGEHLVDAVGVVRARLHHGWPDCRSRSTAPLMVTPWKMSREP